MTQQRFVSTPEDVVRRRNSIRSFKAKANEKRSTADKAADIFTASFGTVFFLVCNIVLFALWMLWNTGVFTGLTVFDPFPFNFLTMIVSLEAIFLAIIVLISQNREARIADLREEVELYINRYAETEITKLMYLQTLLLKKNGIDISEDAEVQQMLKSLESDKIEHELEKQLEKF
jgi:uncharacterized membrane protein